MFGLDIRKQHFKASLTRASVSCRDVSDVSCALDRSFSLHFEFLVCNVVTPRMGREPQNGWGGVIVTGSQFFVALWVKMVYKHHLGSTLSAFKWLWGHF